MCKLIIKYILEATLRKESLGLSEYVIEMLGITKSFPGIKANDNINLRLKRGEIHALLGENGAGKSTLMSILFGLYEPDKGEIRKDGKRVKITSPNHATELGIGMVHQHFRLIDIFTVLENIILGAESTSFGFLRKKQARKKVIELSEKYGMKIDPDAKIEDITVGMQQRVEILKMLYRKNEILIFDEPTAVLTPQEISQLMDTMKSFKAEGKSILFITHKLDEIMEVADRVTVLRKGKYITTLETKDTDKQKLSSLMVGRNVELKVKKTPSKPKQTVLKVENLCVNSLLHKNELAVKDVSFNVKSGEILAIAGIDGNGQNELVNAITGLLRVKAGKITICGDDVTKMSVRRRNDSYLCHIPQDRHKHGLVLDFPLKDNMVLQRYYESEFQRLGFIKASKVSSYAEELIKAFDVRSAEGAFSITRSLSGGNQQKAIIAREFDRKKPLIIAVQPTRGLDVGAIEYIHSQIIKKRDEGHAVLLVSLELDEVMNVSDRIIVIHEGKTVGEFLPQETTVRQLGLAMTGTKQAGDGNE